MGNFVKLKLHRNIRGRAAAASLHTFDELNARRFVSRACRSKKQERAFLLHWKTVKFTTIHVMVRNCRDCKTLLSQLFCFEARAHASREGRKKSYIHP